MCTADALLRSTTLRSAVGTALPHLALLMPDAVGDVGSGVDLATGRGLHSSTSSLNLNRFCH